MELVSRQSSAVEHPAAAALGQVAGIGGSLPEVLQVCNAIASGGELVPRAYQGKPGAVLLAKMWADRHGVDLFTAIQNLDIIDGKPFVKTAMRVELATAKGFEFRVDETTREVCTVTVVRGGSEVGSITARLDDRPRRLKTKSGVPTPWAIYPDDMLFAEACRRADRLHVRTAASLVDQSDYVDETPDPVDVVAAVAEVEQGSSVEQDDDPPAAEPDLPAAHDPVQVEADIKLLLKEHKIRQLQALQWAQGEFGASTLADVAAEPERVRALLDWIDQQNQGETR